MPTLRADSTVYLKGTFTVDHDITGKVIEVAIPATTTSPTLWQAVPVGQITVAETPAGSGTWLVTYKMLIGPLAGQFAPVTGNYDWTIRITDTVERPVVKVPGSLKITDT